MPAASPTDYSSATHRFEKLIEGAPCRHWWFAVAFGMVLVGIDFISGPDIIVPAYFILPTMLLAWNSGARASLALSAALSLAHLSFLHFWGMSPTSVHPIANALLRTGVLLILAFVTGRLGAQTRAARARVQMLEGILPTCSFCKDIRNDAGDWERIEAYVSRHSEAEFSHGVCPPCAEKHFGMKHSHVAPSFGDTAARPLEHN